MITIKLCSLLPGYSNSAKSTNTIPVCSSFIQLLLEIVDKFDIHNALLNELLKKKDFTWLNYWNLELMALLVGSFKIGILFFHLFILFIDDGNKRSLMNVYGKLCDFHDDTAYEVKLFLHIIVEKCRIY